MSNTMRIDHNEIQTQRNRDRMELVDAEFRGFEEKRLEILAHMKDLDTQVIRVEQSKLDETKAFASFQEVKGSI